MLQKLPEYNPEWGEDTSQFSGDFIKTSNGESDQGYFLEADVQYPEELHKLYHDLWFFQKEWKSEKS